MAQRPDTRAMLVLLRRYIGAEMYGNGSYADAITGVIIEIRSAIHIDDASSMSELRGPLGILESIAQEQYNCIGDEKAARIWNRRWRAALRQASGFADKVLGVPPYRMTPVR